MRMGRIFVFFKRRAERHLEVVGKPNVAERVIQSIIGETKHFYEFTLLESEKQDIVIRKNLWKERLS